MDEDDEIRRHISENPTFLGNSSRGQSASEQQRFGFNISPPTIPRSAYDDTGHIFPSPGTTITTSGSSAFSTMSQEHRGQIPAVNTRISDQQTPSPWFATNFRSPLTSSRVGQNYFTPLSQSQLDLGDNTDEESKVSAFLQASPHDVTSQLPAVEVSQHRYRPASATPSVDTLGSIDESASSEFGPRRLRTPKLSNRGRGRSRSTDSRRSLSSRGRRIESASPKISPRNPGKETPPPQNLRGDPFRSAKVKTELCRNFFTEKGCPFGDKCNYAHGEEELKFTKLVDLERAGLIDIEIFRTHPCPTWVATGSCPFDQRCSGLHDPRVESEPSTTAWLPHTETMVNKVVEDGSNVDRFYHEQLSSIYNCCPIFGFIPLAQSKNTEDCSELSWNHFYKFVCNLDIEDPDNNSFCPPTAPSSPIDEEFKLDIVLKMRESRLGASYSYLPSHIFRGDLCMILQSRKYIVRTLTGPENTPVKILKEVPVTNTEEVNASSDFLFEAHEIAFGPVGDPTVPPLSILFDIGDLELVPCTAQQAKHHKRSRHRLKKVKRLVQGSMRSKDAEDRSIIPSFHHYQPRDDVTFDLITRVLRHRLGTVRLYSSNYAANINYRAAYQALDIELRYLQRSYQSLVRFWLAFSYPEQALESPIDENSDVPPVDGEYNCFMGEVKYSRSNEFSPLGAQRYQYQMSPTATWLPSFLWISFILNMSVINQRIINQDDLENILVSNNNPFFRMNRLPVFRHLSTGGYICPLRNLYIRSIATHHYAANVIEKMCDNWEQIKKHYTENPDMSINKPQAISGKKPNHFVSDQELDMYLQNLSYLPNRQI